LITTYSQPKSRKTARSHAKAEEVPAWSRWWFLAILFLYLIQPLCSLCPLWLDSETENLTSVHDADGNTTTRSYSASGRAQTLIWDGLGRLIKVAERNGSNDGYDWSAKYDGANRRLVTSYQKITANLPSPNSQLLTTQSFFDPQVEFLEIGLTTEDTESTETFWKVYGPDANGVYGGLQGIGGLEAIHRVSASETTGVIADYFGHATARTDGTVVTWADASLSGYGPLPGSLASPINQSGDLSTSVSWQGRYIDPTGYFCVGARYYEPNSGRFISADPLGHEASMDLYSYANGDPINMADPDGRFASGIYNGVSSNGNIGSSAPSSNSYYTGNIIGAAFSGYAQGLGQGAQNVSGYTRYQEHLTMFDGDVYNAANAAWNPAYLAATGFYQAGTGTGLAPSNIGTQLDWVDRSIAGAEGVLGTVGTVGLATGLTQTGSAARGTPRTNFNQYETLFEAPITGTTRGAHRTSANNFLSQQLDASPDLQRMFNQELGTDVLQHMNSGAGRNFLNPPGTVWHHPVDNPSVMRLLRTGEHTNPLLQPTLHPGPNGTGGFGTFFGTP